jgi:hypothetical protein
MQALQLSLSRQQPIERIPVGLPVATGIDAIVQLHAFHPYNQCLS